MRSSEGSPLGRSALGASVVRDKSILQQSRNARSTKTTSAMKKSVLLSSSSKKDLTPYHSSTRPSSSPLMSTFSAPSPFPPTTSSSSAPISPSHPSFLKSPAESDLKMSFDPMKDLHMWTMWRVAVNGRIVDETRRRNRAQPTQGGDFDPNPYGRALVRTPLGRFIRVGQSSQDIAEDLMDPNKEGGAGRLETQQFVYYGVPRVVLNKGKRKLQSKSQLHE